MSNHLHAILTLTRNRTERLSQVVGGFKSRCYREWRATQLAAGQPTPASCWQRNYYERIIRDASELEAYRRYIADNPSRWNST